MKKIDRNLLKPDVPATDEVWQHDTGDHYRVRVLKEKPSAAVALLLPEHVMHVVTVACCDAVGDVTVCTHNGRHIIFGRHELYLDPAKMRTRGESPAAQREIWTQRLIERGRRLELMRRNLEPLITKEPWTREIPTPYGLKVKVHGTDTTETEVITPDPAVQDFVNFKVVLEVVDANDAPIVDDKGSPFASAGIVTVPLAEILDRGEDETAFLAERLEREANMLAVSAANYLES